MHHFLVGVSIMFLFVTAPIGALPLEAQTDRQQRHRVPADFMSYQGAAWLERADRVVEEQPQRVLEVMALESGDVVADVGCGSGYYARKIAPLVGPGGLVYCEDIQPEMLEIMERLAGEEGVTGIESVLGTPSEPRLPADALDWVIIADVYHEMSDPVQMLAGIRGALAPGGQVALLEYRAEDGTGDQIKADHRMSVRQVLSEWKAAGFQLVALHEFLPSQHLFFFRPAEEAAEPTLDDHDLYDAIEAGAVEAEARGDGDGAVRIRIRRTGGQPMIVTSPVGGYFRSDGEARDMVARRDGWVVLADDDWHEWSVRAVGRQRDRDPPSSDDHLTILPPSTEPTLAELMHQLQIGTYTVTDPSVVGWVSPTLYPPITHQIEQAAVWITDADLAYEEMESDIQNPRIPAQYAVAFALVFVDRAGIDVTSRRVWGDSGRVFQAVRDRGLALWYQLKSTAP